MPFRRLSFWRDGIGLRWKPVTVTLETAGAMVRQSGRLQSCIEPGVYCWFMPCRPRLPLIQSPDTVAPMNQPNHPFSPIGAALKKLWRFQVAGFLLLLLFALCGPLTAAAQPTNTLQDQIADVQFEMDKAIAQVQKIVNQPVTAYARQPGMEVPTTEGGWFHPGADKPDFNN